MTHRRCKRMIPALELYGRVLNLLLVQNLTTKQAASKLGVCGKTIKRTVDALRDLGVNIVYVDAAHCWVLKPTVKTPDWFRLFQAAFDPDKYQLPR